MPNAAPQTQLDPQAHAAHALPIKELAETLAQAACARGDHQIALAALISAYASVAVAHPCCARQSVELARTLADFIESDATATRVAHN